MSDDKPYTDKELLLLGIETRMRELRDLFNDCVNPYMNIDSPKFPEMVQYRAEYFTLKQRSEVLKSEMKNGK